MTQDESMDADKIIVAETANVRAYYGTEMHTHLVRLLHGLKVSYMHDLIDVKPEELQLKQGALRQVIGLIDSITGSANSLPRI